MLHNKQVGLKGKWWAVYFK